MPALKGSRKKSLDLREQVGQLLIMGFEGPDPDQHVVRLMKQLQPGGVILFARNITSAPQTYDFLSVCRQNSNTAPFTCVDLEGGLVDRFREILAPAPSQHSVGVTRSRKLFREFGTLLGNEARLLGFNTDFAPVSDIGFAPSHSVLGSRTISPSAEETIVYVREFLRGMKAAGVLGCGKHFPGLGEANLDTHHELPSIDKEWRKMWNEDLLPYRRLHKLFPFVMVAHAAYPCMTKDRTPASLSKKWMNDILRKKIGYRGIILSDDLEMGGVLAAASMEEAAVETLRAGADMFLVCRKEDYVVQAWEAVLRRAETDSKFAQRVKEASARVVAYKKRAAELKRVAPRPTEKTVEKLCKQIQAFKQKVEKASVAL